MDKLRVEAIIGVLPNQGMFVDQLGRRSQGWFICCCIILSARLSFALHMDLLYLVKRSPYSVVHVNDCLHVYV